jgi:hypothetical protein
MSKADPLSQMQLPLGLLIAGRQKQAKKLQLPQNLNYVVAKPHSHWTLTWQRGFPTET